MSAAVASPRLQSSCASPASRLRAEQKTLRESQRRRDAEEQQRRVQELETRRLRTLRDRALAETLRAESSRDDEQQRLRIAAAEAVREEQLALERRLQGERNHAVHVKNLHGFERGQQTEALAQQEALLKESNAVTLREEERRVAAEKQEAAIAAKNEELAKARAQREGLRRQQEEEKLDRLRRDAEDAALRAQQKEREMATREKRLRATQRNDLLAAQRQTRGAQQEQRDRRDEAFEEEAATIRAKDEAAAQHRLRKLQSKEAMRAEKVANLRRSEQLEKHKIALEEALRLDTTAAQEAERARLEAQHEALLKLQEVRERGEAWRRSHKLQAEENACRADGEYSEWVQKKAVTLRAEELMRTTQNLHVQYTEQTLRLFHLYKRRHEQLSWAGASHATSDGAAGTSDNDSSPCVAHGISEEDNSTPTRMQQALLCTTNARCRHSKKVLKDIQTFKAEGRQLLEQRRAEQESDRLAAQARARDVKEGKTASNAFVVGKSKRLGTEEQYSQYIPLYPLKDIPAAKCTGFLRKYAHVTSETLKRDRLADVLRARKEQDLRYQSDTSAQQRDAECSTTLRLLAKELHRQQHLRNLATEQQRQRQRAQHRANLEAETRTLGPEESGASPQAVVSTRFGDKPWWDVRTIKRASPYITQSSECSDTDTDSAPNSPAAPSRDTQTSATSFLRGISNDLVKADKRARRLRLSV